MNKTKVTFNALTDRFEYDLERLIVSLATKKSMMEVLFLLVMMYRCESWTEKEQNGKKMIKYIRDSRASCISEHIEALVAKQKLSIIGHVVMK